MNTKIKILHERKLVGEAIAWSMRFAYDYDADFVPDVHDLTDPLQESTVILTDRFHFFNIVKAGHISRCKVIVLVDDIENSEVVDILAAGAATVVDLSKGPEPVIEKVQQIWQSRTDDQDILIQKLLHQQMNGKAPEDNSSYNLTAKEREILKLLREGAHLKLIAHNTGTAYETVRTHMKHIYRKIGVASASEAVIKAMKMNL